MQLQPHPMLLQGGLMMPVPQGPMAPMPPQFQPPPSQPAQESMWFYMARGDKPVGPFPLSQIRTWHREGHFNDRVKVSRAQTPDQWLIIVNTECAYKPQQNQPPMMPNFPQRPMQPHFQPLQPLQNRPIQNHQMPPRHQQPHPMQRRHPQQQRPHPNHQPPFQQRPPQVMQQRPPQNRMRQNMQPMNFAQPMQRVNSAPQAQQPRPQINSAPPIQQPPQQIQPTKEISKEKQTSLVPQKETPAPVKAVKQDATTSSPAIATKPAPTIVAEPEKQI